MAEKIRMALIGTYPKLAEVFLNLTDSRHNIIAYNIYASFEEAAEIARQMEDELDIILSRGGTAEYIRNAVHIPVLSIPIMPFDVIKAIHSMEPMPESLALIQYRKNVRDIQAIADLFHIRIEEYTFLSKSDIKKAIEDAIQKNIQIVIGGHVAVEMATNMGLRAIELSAGEQALDQSIDQAITMHTKMREEQQRDIRVRSALNSLSEGIVLIDNERRIVSINKEAAGLFQRQYRKGEVAGPEILTKECLNVYSSKKPYPVYIKRIRKETYSITHTPILKGNNFLGVVSRYENVTKTEALEQKIRKEINAKGFDAAYQFSDILTEDPYMKMVKKKAEIYAKTDSYILIQGESGTGKELFAQSIHNASPRKSRPFVAVNCAAIPESLLESELFGYEKGAFTGAVKEGKEGFFELAHLGTLFLDEIGEVSMEVQTRLLRVLQEHEIMRVGGDKIIPVDVRIISATNKDLEKEVREGNFREDLYYRLNILSLKIPPLRKRIGDVRLMASRFAAKFKCEEEDLALLLPGLGSYQWPGNVRELHNIVERYCVLYPFWKEGLLEADALMEALELQNREPEREIPAEHVSKEIAAEPQPVLEPVSAGETSFMTIQVPEGKTLTEIVNYVEYLVSRKYLEDHGNDPEEAARALGIGRTTLWRKSKANPMNP